LVVLPTSTPYVALSYVWGNVPVLKATKSNVATLKSPGALVEAGMQIPDIIRDAIYLVKAWENVTYGSIVCVLFRTKTRKG
jgi:hypothetical protein